MLAGQSELHFDLLEPSLDQTTGSLGHLAVRHVSLKRATGVSGHPPPPSSKHLPQGLIQRLATDIPQGNVDGRKRQHEDAPRT